MGSVVLGLFFFWAMHRGISTATPGLSSMTFVSISAANASASRFEGVDSLLEFAKWSRDPRHPTKVVHIPGGIFFKSPLGEVIHQQVSTDAPKQEQAVTTPKPKKSFLDTLNSIKKVDPYFFGVPIMMILEELVPLMSNCVESRPCLIPLLFSNRVLRLESTKIVDMNFEKAYGTLYEGDDCYKMALCEFASNVTSFDNEKVFRKMIDLAPDSYKRHFQAYFKDSAFTNEDSKLCEKYVCKLKSSKSSYVYLDV